MKNKKIIITLSIIAILVLTIGVSFAVFTYNKVSTNNSNLIVGDIYMHYNETNQVQMENAMPTNPYIINPIMASQEYEALPDTRNELSKCVDYFNNLIGTNYDDGTTGITYCRGTGTAYNGYTLQQDINNNVYDDTQLTKLKELNVVTSDNKVNPIMASQEYEALPDTRNELSKCVDGFIERDFSTEQALLLCKGDTLDDLTLQQVYEHGYLDEMNLTDTFIQENVLTINSTIPYFEFTIDGKNTTTNKDIWYEVVLSKGDNLEGKTRIKDNLLKFRLVEIKDNNETIVVDDKSYDDLTSKRIWVNTINKNTTNEISITYRLYMWISSDTNIGNTDDVDYTMEEWNNIFASIKVNVSGDFNEKYMEVDTYCFKTEENETGLTITDYNSSCGSKIVIPETIDDLKVTQIASNAFYDKNLVYINIPSSVVKIGAYAFMKNNITSINIPNTVTDLHCKSFDDGVVKNRDMTCVATNESCFTVGTINDGNEVAILDYDATCGTDVIIPSTIKGYPVTIIGNNFTNVIEQLSNKTNNYSFNDLNNYQKNVNIKPTGTVSVSGSFQNKNLTSVVIPNSVTMLEEVVFSNNQLTSITIPDSVTQIGNSAFKNNQLTNVTFTSPSNLKTIDYGAFKSNNITSVTIPDSVTYLECSAFDSTVSIAKNDDLTCTNNK